MEMKNLIRSGLDFIKSNTAIISSLVLIVVMVGIIFFNSYYILNKLEDNTNVILQKEAVLIEDVIHVFLVDLFENKEQVQKKIEEVKNRDSEIGDISVLVPMEKEDGFQVLASTDRNVIGKNISNELYDLAWSSGERGIAYLNSGAEGRSWDVAKIIENSEGKIGLTVLNLSLASHDNFTSEKIKNIYLVAFVSVMIVLLLVLNHFRLFHYAVRATKLEEIDRMKDEFISMASHELKTPMTSIVGYIDLMRDISKKRNDEISQEELHYLENIDISIDRLRNLVDDILEVSRLEQNRLIVNMQEVDLMGIVGRVVENLKVVAKSKDLSLVYGNYPAPLVLADPVRVEQILINLVGNAIKYTPKGKIEILFKEDERFLYLTVSDTGLGISGENLRNLFAKFYRIKTQETMEISGTGLGLWISKQLADKMRGDIIVESIKGIGSHFTLKLEKIKK